MDQQNQQQATYNEAVNKQRAINDKWSNAINAYEKTRPDIRAVLEEAGDIKLDTTVLNEILDTDAPAAIVYDLAKNPDKALKLSEMSEKARNRFLIKMELKLENETAQPAPVVTEDIVEEPAPVAAPIKTAPKPIGVKNAKSGAKKGKDPVLDFLAEWDEFDRAKNY